MSFTDDIKANLKEGIQDKIEQNTGIIGQALAARRKRKIKQKEVAREVAEIQAATTRIRANDSALAKIETSMISISQNMQLINRWSDATVDTQEESDKTAEKIRAESKQPELVVQKIGDDNKEEENGFGGLLDVLSKVGKIKFPKLGKKGKLGLLLGGVAATGAVAQSMKIDTEPTAPTNPPTVPPVNYTPEPSVSTPPPPPPPNPVVPPPPPPKPVVPPPPPPQPAAPKPTPAAIQKPEGTTTPPLDVTKTPPSTKSVSITKEAAPEQPKGSASLSSVVKLQDSNVSLSGINPTFEAKVATMATSFKQQTGKPLLITSGIRTNEKQKELFDAKVAQLGGNEAAAKKLVAEPMAPLGKGRGSMHLKGLAIDINSRGDGGINTLAGTRDAPTGWLEKFGLMRPVPNEDWHVQASGTPPTGDVGGVPGKGGAPVDPSTGKAIAVPTDPSTGKSLLDNSKTVAQLKRENAQPGQTTIVATNTTNKTVYDKKKQPQGETLAAVG